MLWVVLLPCMTEIYTGTYIYLYSLMIARIEYLLSVTGKILCYRFPDTGHVRITVMLISPLYALWQ